MVKKGKGVFCDRDGVINKLIKFRNKGHAPKNLKDFKILPSSIKATKLLKKHGFHIFIVSNQPDVGKGIISKGILEKMNQKIKNKMDIDKIMICTHKQNDNCKCRKPKPLMLKQLIKKYKLNSNKSFMVGDRTSDIEAGINAKCRTVFIDNNSKEKKPSVQEATFKSLIQAARYIIRQ